MEHVGGNIQLTSITKFFLALEPTVIFLPTVSKNALYIKDKRKYYLQNLL